MVSTSTKQSVATRLETRRCRTGSGIRRQRPQRRALLAVEAIARTLVRGTVNALIGFDHPARQVRLELGEAGEC
jgi:hypothetical protein